MKGGYASIVWIKDKNGKEYACYLEDVQGKNKEKEDLTPEQLRQCLDVNQLIGTERW